MNSLGRYFLGLLILLPLLSVQQIKAQNPETEELIKQVRTAQGKEKINLLAELSYRFFQTDPRLGIRYGKESVQLALNQKHPELTSKAYNNLGACYIVLSNQDSARYFLDKAIRNAVIYKDTFEQATAANRIGVVFENQGIFDSALISFHHALGLFKQLKDPAKMGLINNNIGKIHLHRGELKTALSSFLEAEAVFRNAGIRNNLPTVCMGIGIVYSKTGDYQTAEKWFLKGKQTAREIGDFQSVGIAVNAMGILYKDQGKNEEALTAYREVIAMGDQVNSHLRLAAHGNTGNVYQNMGDYQKALDYHRKGLVIAESMNNPFLIAEQHVGIGIALNSMHQYLPASASFKKALPVFSSSGSSANLLITYEGLIKASKGLSDYRQAVDFLEQYLALKDTLTRTELNSALDSLKVKFNTEHTLRENQLLAQEIELKSKTIRLQKTLVVSALGAAALLLSLVLVIVRSRKKLSKFNTKLAKQNEEITASAEEIRLKNEQLMALSRYKDSMNSFLVHDLKNPLNTIINFDAEQVTSYQAEGIRQSGKQMLNLVSNLLDISKNDKCKLMLKPENTALSVLVKQAVGETAFLAEQKSIRFYLDAPTDFMLMADPALIKRVLVNMITNAIKFSPPGGQIRIHPQQEAAEMVKIWIEDQGEGIPEDFLPLVFEQYSQKVPRKSGFSASTGIGLAFCKMAVEAHGGEIGVLSGAGNGASFWFTLPAADSQGLQAESLILPDFPESLSQNIQLSPEDKVYLNVFCRQFKEISVFHFTEAKAIVQTMENQSPGLIQWKATLMEALTTCNEVKYKELILNNDEPTL